MRALILLSRNLSDPSVTLVPRSSLWAWHACKRAFKPQSDAEYSRALHVGPSLHPARRSARLGRQGTSKGQGRSAAGAAGSQRPFLSGCCEGGFQPGFSSCPVCNSSASVICACSARVSSMKARIVSSSDRLRCASNAAPPSAIGRYSAMTSSRARSVA